MSGGEGLSTALFWFGVRIHGGGLGKIKTLDIYTHLTKITRKCDACFR